MFEQKLFSELVELNLYFKIYQTNIRIIKSLGINYFPEFLTLIHILKYKKIKLIAFGKKLCDISFLHIFSLNEYF